MNEIIVVNKKTGLTSRDVVNKLVKILNTKHIGHSGTLDPMATGVLVCLTNKYTKLVDLITCYEKEYIAEIKLGIKTDTLDITGNVLEKTKVPNLDNSSITKVLESFLGKSLQTVPLYSAKSINGKRLYEYARKGIDIDLPKIEIDIKEIELLDYHDDIIKFRCIVSKGTYIRSLINEICTKLNTLGTMSGLIRTKQGNFSINNAYTLEDIEENHYKSLQLKDVLKIKEIELDELLYKKVSNGNIIEANLNGFILYKKNNVDIALYYFEENIGRLKILF